MLLCRENSVLVVTQKRGKDIYVFVERDESRYILPDSREGTIHLEEPPDIVCTKGKIWIGGKPVLMLDLKRRVRSLVRELVPWYIQPFCRPWLKVIMRLGEDEFSQEKVFEQEVLYVAGSSIPGWWRYEGTEYNFVRLNVLQELFPSALPWKDLVL